ncbi:MAG TPA: protease complex subunit PrcB family protein [Clostridiales bacterium]|nr:protease complex subunit PrcB family protein [Clostridiales bacterium]
MKKHKGNVLLTVPLLAFIIISLSGCKAKDSNLKKIQDLEYTIVEEADIPEALLTYIDDKKENPFKLSYSNENDLYIVIGYGKQLSGGYSITVDELYESEENIIIKTNLVGPSKEETNESVTYPYIVLKIKFTEKKPEFM